MGPSRGTEYQESFAHRMVQTYPLDMHGHVFNPFAFPVSCPLGLVDGKLTHV